MGLKLALITLLLAGPAFGATLKPLMAHSCWPLSATIELCRTSDVPALSES